MSKLSRSAGDPIRDELDAIKKLLVVGLLRDGTSQAEVAAALGVTQGTVSRMFPSGLGHVARRTRKRQG